MKVKLLLLLCSLIVLASCGGSGGGGGTGGGSTSNITGRVIWIETGSGPNPAATVRSGSKSQTTDVNDGFFDFETETGVTSATVTTVPTGGLAIVRTFTFPPASGTADLGDLYVGPQEVNITGVVEDVSTSLPVAGAKIRIGGREATSASNGKFTVAKVAYSDANPNVFLGLDGIVTSTDFFERHFNPGDLASGGTLNVGVISLTPKGSVDPPPPPFNVAGTITPANLASGASYLVKLGTTTLRSGKADANGQFKVWLPKGTYIVSASKGSNSGQTTLTVTSTNVTKSVKIAF